MIIYRQINEADYEDICDISKDIWEGNDYLPAIFHTWAQDTGYFLGAVDSTKNKVVGVGKYSILHDKTGWLEGLRVHKDYRGQKISRGIMEALLIIATEELEKGNIKKIGFGTHVTNIESISLMKKLNFKLKQEFILIEGNKDKYSAPLFDIKPWSLSFEDFLELKYFKVRENILPITFIFQEPTLALYNELKEHQSFITINGFNGIFKLKGEPHFIAVDDNFESIDVFMQYALGISKDKNLTSPFTSILPTNTELIKALKINGYEVWSNWQPDYLYYIYE